jgi:hypothetical protein
MRDTLNLQCTVVGQKEEKSAVEKEEQIDNSNVGVKQLTGFGQDEVRHKPLQKVYHTSKIRASRKNTAAIFCKSRHRHDLANLANHGESRSPWLEQSSLLQVCNAHNVALQAVCFCLHCPAV